LFKEFRFIMERRMRDNLEQIYREQGPAKFKNGEFFLQDLNKKKDFTMNMPWKAMMKPGQMRHMSVIFKESPDSR
jgi:hypothetical protein